MRISSGLRAALIALTALTGVSLSSAAQADSGFINITVIKAGWIIGGSGGSGTLTFQGRRYPLSIGGISYGLVFGAAQTNLRGRVSNITRPSDVIVSPPASRLARPKSVTCGRPSLSMRMFDGLMSR